MHLYVNTASRFLYIVSRVSHPAWLKTSSELVSHSSLCMMRPALVSVVSVLSIVSMLSLVSVLSSVHVVYSVYAV